MKYFRLYNLPSKSLPVPGSQMVGTALKLERERENKTRGIRRLVSPQLLRFFSRSFSQFTLSPLSRSLEQAKQFRDWNRMITYEPYFLELAAIKNTIAIKTGHMSFKL